MQKKSLLVALFCGALCLTGCLKNEESASVTQVRNAKAKELESIAALNNAKAQAEVTLANAEATLMQAQAKVQEAAAAKMAAETAWQEIENQIHQIDIQLKQLDVTLKEIEVEAARVKLESAKADLEKKQAELAVAKAKADAELAKWAAELEKVQAQMEVDAIKAAVALMEAEKSMADEIAAVAEAGRAYIEKVAAKYFQLQTEILQLQTEILENTNTIALLEAGIKDPEQVYADYIAENQAKINMYKALYEKAMEYAPDMTEEEYYAELTAVTANLIDAQNIYQAMLTAVKEAAADVEAANTELAGGSTFAKITSDATSDFNTYLAKNAKVDDVTNDWVYTSKQGTDEEEDIVLFTPQSKGKQMFVYVPEDLDVEELEKEGLDPKFYLGAAKQAAKDFKNDLTKAPVMFAIYFGDEVDSIAPAAVNAANFEIMFAEKLAKAQEIRDDKINGNEEKGIKSFAQLRDEKAQGKRNEIAKKEQEKKAKEDFLASLESKYSTAETNLENAKKAVTEKSNELTEAARVLKNAKIAGAAAVEEAWYNYNKAKVAYEYKDATDATKSGPKEKAIAANLALENAKGKVLPYKTQVLEDLLPTPVDGSTWYDTKNNVNFYMGDANKNIRDWYVQWYNVHKDDSPAATIAQQYDVVMTYRDMIINQYAQEVNALKTDTWNVQLKTYYTEKANAYTTAKEELATAKLNVVTKYDQMIAAEAAYLADPTKKEAFIEAQTLYNAAKAAVTAPDGAKVKAVEDAKAYLTEGYTNKEGFQGLTTTQCYLKLYGKKSDKKDILDNEIENDGEIYAAETALKGLQDRAKKIDDGLKALEDDLDETKAGTSAKKAADAVAAAETEAKKVWGDKFADFGKDSYVAGGLYKTWKEAYDAIDKNSDAGKAYTDAYAAVNGGKNSKGEDVKGAEKVKKEAEDALDLLNATYKFNGVDDYADDTEEVTCTYPAIKLEFETTADGKAKNDGVLRDLENLNTQLNAILREYDDPNGDPSKGYWGWIAGAEFDLQQVKDEIAAARAEVNKLVAYTEAYEALVEQYNGAIEDWCDAQYEAELAEFNRNIYQAKYNALVADAMMYDKDGKYRVVEGEEVVDTIVNEIWGYVPDGTETITVTLGTGIFAQTGEVEIPHYTYEKLYEFLDTVVEEAGVATAYYYAYAAYYAIAQQKMIAQAQTNWNNTKAINKLELENTQKAAQIELKTKFAEYYEDILNGFLAEDDEEEAE